MNLGGHIAVAAVDNSDPAFWLGSALPDLAAMARFRLLGSTDHAPVAAGIAFHHATDSAFHAHPWFIATQRRLYQRLTADGFERGPARAIAHVGPELLLDGAIEHRQQLERSLATLEMLAPALGSLVEEAHRQDWAQHLERLRTTEPPSDHDDPQAVALRLQRMLQRRARLAFPANRVDHVAERLADVKPDIDKTATSLVTELAKQLCGT